MLDFRGKHVLVVGGTSGIGREIALQFAQAGGNVTAVSHEPTPVKKVTTEIKACGVDSLEIVCDVTNPEQVQAMFQTITQSWGKLDVVVNSQGTHHKKPSSEVEDALFAKVMDVNLKSVFSICREAYPLLKAASGTIINIASMASFIGLRDAAAYTASKGGVAQLTKALAVDWAADGIRCNAIAPGWIITPLSQAALEKPEYRDPILKRIPLGRLGTVTDVSGMALFLASELAQYVTGTVIPVDGGAMASV